MASCFSASSPRHFEAIMIFRKAGSCPATPRRFSEDSYPQQHRRGNLKSRPEELKTFLWEPSRCVAH